MAGFMLGVMSLGIGTTMKIFPLAEQVFYLFAYIIVVIICLRIAASTTHSQNTNDKHNDTNPHPSKAIIRQGDHSSDTTN